ncbi:MAG: PEP-CTERM sorting domain-containing protein [Planctomycetota bacterium]
MTTTARLVALSLYSAISCTAHGNVLVNGSFELPLTMGFEVAGAPGAPWVGFNDPAVRFTNKDLAFDGEQSVKTFGPFDFIGGGVGATQVQPATAGNVYGGEIYAYHMADDALQGSNFGVFNIEFLDAAGELVGGEPLTGVNIFPSNQITADSPTDEWIALGAGGVAPEGTESVRALFVQVQLGTETSPDIFEEPFLGGAIFWDAAAIRDEGPFVPGFIPGDFDNDGVVLNSDLNLLLDNWGATEQPEGWINSFTPDPGVNNNELNALLNTWGEGVPAAVPEPTAVVLASLAAVGFARRRR